jgi:hypothetical protein
MFEFWPDAKHDRVAEVRVLDHRTIRRVDTSKLEFATTKSLTEIQAHGGLSIGIQRVIVPAAMVPPFGQSPIHASQKGPDRAASRDVRDHAEEGRAVDEEMQDNDRLVGWNQDVLDRGRWVPVYLEGSGRDGSEHTIEEARSEQLR